MKDYSVAGLSVWIIAGFAITILGQFVALALIPATRGFTSIVPTMACVLFFIASLAISARLVHSGVELSLLTPIATVVLQILVLAVSIIVYKESASPMKIGLLLGAALMIGAATRL